MNAQPGRGCPASRWGVGSKTKTLHEDYHFYTGYNLAARSPRFIDLVMPPDYLQVPNYNALTSMRVVINSDRYLCIMIPTIKRRNLGDYEESQLANHAVMEIWNIRTIINNSNRYIDASISMEKEVSFWLPSKTLHKSTFSLASAHNEDSHSPARGFSAATTPGLLTWKVFFPFLYFWQNQSGASDHLWRKIPTKIWLLMTMLKWLISDLWLH